MELPLVKYKSRLFQCAKYLTASVGLFLSACKLYPIYQISTPLLSPTIQATQQIPTPSPTLSQPSPMPSTTILPALTSELTPTPGITPPQTLTLELSASLGGATTAADVQGDFIYVGIGAELVILSKNEGHLTQLSSTRMPAIVEDVKAVGDYVYVAAGAKGLQVLDISTPSTPVEIGFNHDLGGFRSDPVASSNYLYTSGMEIISLTDPTSPTLLSDLPVSRSEGDTAIVVADHYAYIAAGDQGLRIIDVTDPTAPIEIGAFTPSSVWFADIELVDNLAYIAGGDLYVVDVSDPHHPVSVAVFDTPGSANGVSVAGDYIYVADGNAGLTILSIVVKR